MEEGSTHIDAASILPSSLNRTYAVARGTPGIITRDLSQAEFIFEIAQPEDDVRVSTYLFGKKGYPLFSGYNSFRLENQFGIWKIPRSANVELELNQEIPLTVPNAVYAYIVHRNDRGDEVGRTYLRIEDDEIFFNPWMVSTPGELYLVMFNQSVGQYTLVYEWENGQMITPQFVAGTIVASLPNYVEVDDVIYPEDRAVTVPLVASTKHYHNAPAVLLRLIHPRTITFKLKIVDGTGRTVEYPSTAWYYKKGANEEHAISLSRDGDGVTGQLTLPAGDYWIYPVTESWKRSSFFIPGGKG